MNDILIELTDKCNLRCNYCFERKRNLLRECIDNKNTDSINDLWELSRNPSIENVIFSGGEPLLYENIDEIMKLFSQKQLTILTNGIQRIRNREILSTLDIVVSLDGDFEVMNKHRGIDKKTFKKILQNIEWYIKNAKSTTINTVITPYNINNENFYPFELFGEACFYKFATPSIAFTPSNLKLNSSEYEKFQRLLCFYLEKYSYHMKSSINIINKRFIKENINEVAKDIIIPEYNLHKRTYYLFDKAYASYNELMKGNTLLRRELKICY